MKRILLGMKNGAVLRRMRRNRSRFEFFEYVPAFMFKPGKPDNTRPQCQTVGFVGFNKKRRGGR
jgi:hypothetical protein